jgi:hypothetical protein
MFPSTKIRFKAAARRGIDLAIEFATLGEYRLAEVAEAPGSETVASRPRRARGARGGRLAEPMVVAAGAATGRPIAQRVGPATAAARRLQPAKPVRRPQTVPRRGQPAVLPTRISGRTGVRGLALESSRAPQVRGRRKRAGAAPPRPQPCLVADPPRTS